MYICLLLKRPAAIGIYEVNPPYHVRDSKY